MSDSELHPGPAVVTIGDELVFGERDDANGRWLLSKLWSLGRPAGVALRLPDDVAVIGDWIGRLKVTGHCPILTSGGLGGTHDDLTREGIACGLGRALVRNAECDALLRARYGDRYNPQRARMAMLPEDCTLIHNPDGAPGFRVDGVYSFPGFPHMLKPMVETVLDGLFDGGLEDWIGEDLIVAAHEGRIAQQVGGFSNDYPRARVGIYPGADLSQPRTTVRLRYRLKDAACLDQLRALLAPWLTED